MMTKAPIPHDDEARIAALEATGVLSAGAEERFDRFTRLAQRMFDVPIAIISLVHRNKQYFKSIQGLSATETSRDEAFCAHAILGDELLVVEDAQTDPRFDENPLVCGEPHIRFYAGCPLITNDGYRIGTLCLVDHEARKFSADDRMALTDLGALVAAEMSTLRLATVDELTGLSNRRGFNLIADQALQMCRRNTRRAALLMLDLDGFTQINEQLGNASGDKALVEFAQLLTSSYRNSDVVSRLGDDTFCVLLTDTDFEHSWVSVERFRTTLTARNELPGRKYRLLFSAAVVQCDFERHASTARLLQDAEVAMHERKRAKPLPQRTPAVCVA